MRPNNGDWIIWKDGATKAYNLGRVWSVEGNIVHIMAWTSLTSTTTGAGFLGFIVRREDIQFIGTWTDTAAKMEQINAVTAVRRELVEAADRALNNQIKAILGSLE